VQFDYGGGAPKTLRTEPEEKEFKLPWSLQALEEIVHPNNTKQLDVIVKTAQFLRTQEEAVVAHIRNKQASNPLFDFLWPSHPLHDFYLRVLQMIEDGTLTYTPAIQAAEPTEPTEATATPDDKRNEDPDEPLKVKEGTVTVARGGLLLGDYSDDSDDEVQVMGTKQTLPLPRGPVTSSVVVSASSNLVSNVYNEEYQSDASEDSISAPYVASLYLDIQCNFHSYISFSLCFCLCCCFCFCIHICIRICIRICLCLCPIQHFV
jgi:hypothetical protein